jgi:hypothetical protein
VELPGIEGFSPLNAALRWRLPFAATLGGQGGSFCAGGQTRQEDGEWLKEFGVDVVTLEPSGAVEFFEARLPFPRQVE